MVRAILLVVALAGCGGGSSTEETTPEPGGGEGGDEGGEIRIGGDGRPVGERADPDFAGRLIAIAAGFAPDPRVVEGHAGGTVDATRSHPACVGFHEEEPDHTLVLETAFDELHVLATSAIDVTVVVRRPDGTFLCNDDFQESHPKVTLSQAPAGSYQVWVGNYEEGGAPAPYHLGVTTIATVTPSMIFPDEAEPLDLGDGVGAP